MGFEPTRGDPIGLAGRRLNRSAKVALLWRGGAGGGAYLKEAQAWTPGQGRELDFNLACWDAGDAELKSNPVLGRGLDPAPV